MGTPLVSVIIPTYNRRHLLAEAIRSVLGQTYEHVEVIVVDDGSEDDTEGYVHSLSDARLRFFREEHRGAPCFPRNRGIAESSGEYIAFLDSDDLWVPDKVERQVCVMEGDSDLGMVYGQALVCGGGANNQQPLPDSRSTHSGNIFNALFLRNFIMLLTVMVRKSVLERVGGFDERPEFVAAEDFELWLRIARKFRVCFQEGVVGRYRVHPGNISSGIENKMKQSFAIVDKFRSEGWVDEGTARARERNIYKDGALEFVNAGLGHALRYLKLRWS